MMLAPSAPSRTPAADKPSWDPIVVALRDELEEYGGLIRLFDEQQQKIFARDAAGVTEVVHELEVQTNVARGTRQVRERVVRAFAEKRGQVAGSSLREMLSEFPVDVRPLLTALIEEINDLVRRIRKRGRQNQMLLGRLIDLHRELLPALGRPVTRTYSSRGEVAVRTAGSSTTTYRATG